MLRHCIFKKDFQQALCLLSFRFAIFLQLNQLKKLLLERKSFIKTLYKWEFEDPIQTLHKLSAPSLQIRQM